MVIYNIFLLFCGVLLIGMAKRIVALLLAVLILSVFVGCKKPQTDISEGMEYNSASKQWTAVEKAEKPDFQNGSMSKEEFLNLITPYTDWRIYEIRTQVSQITPTDNGTAYYVSNKGDNSNDGLSPEAPLADYSGVLRKGLKTGDVVYFERGSVWRGQIEISIPGITLTAYGDGKKPEFYMSVKDGANPDFWQKTDAENVWVFDTRISADVGTIIFDDEQWAFKSLYKEADIGNSVTGRYVNTYKDLVNDLQFFHNFRDGKIYLRSNSGNPGERFSKIEFNVGKHIISVNADNTVIDNLCLKYGGAHGIGSSAVDGLTVQNCEIGWIGGSLQSGWQSTVRFGNGVEVWGSAKNFTVNNNYFYQIYDSAMTFQYSGEEVCNMHNIEFTNNVVDKATSAIEYWSGGADGSDINNFTVSNNILLNSGYGMGSQRPEQRGTITVTSGGFKNKLTGPFNITDNIIALSKIELIKLSSRSGDVPECDGNVYVHTLDKFLGYYRDNDTRIKFDGNVGSEIRNTIGDKNAIVIYITED